MAQSQSDNSWLVKIDSVTGDFQSVGNPWDFFVPPPRIAVETCDEDNGYYITAKSNQSVVITFDVETGEIVAETPTTFSGGDIIAQVYCTSPCDSVVIYSTNSSTLDVGIWKFDHINGGPPRQIFYGTPTSPWAPEMDLFTQTTYDATHDRLILYYNIQQTLKIVDLISGEVSDHWVPVDNNIYRLAYHELEDRIYAIETHYETGGGNSWYRQAFCYVNEELDGLVTLNDSLDFAGMNTALFYPLDGGIDYTNNQLIFSWCSNGEAQSRLLRIDIATGIVLSNLPLIFPPYYLASAGGHKIQSLQYLNSLGEIYAVHYGPGYSTLSASNPKNIEQLNIFPTPNSGNFTVVPPSYFSHFEMIMYSQKGNVVYKESGLLGSQNIISDFSSGIYIVQLKDFLSNEYIFKRLIIH